MRSLILELAEGKSCQIDELVSAIRELELQKNYGRGLIDLEGSWKLLWTSGTKQFQQQVQKQFQQVKRAQSTRLVSAQKQLQTIQRIDAQAMQLVNEVLFPFGKISVSGDFSYTDLKRMQFTFNRARLQLGSLLALPLPIGGSGWLQTTYLDPQIHIERGDREGVSIFAKLDHI